MAHGVAGETAAGGGSDAFYFCIRPGRFSQSLQGSKNGMRMKRSSYICASWLITLLDETQVRRLSNLLADMIWYRRGGFIKRLEADLECRVKPHAHDFTNLRIMSRASTRSYSRFILEALRVSVATAGSSVSRITAHGVDHIESCRRLGRGVVLAAPNMGNWEYAVIWLALTFDNVVIVAADPGKSFFWRARIELWTTLGVEVILINPPSDARSSNVFGDLSKHLRSGALVCLLADRNIGSGGIEVDFLNVKAIFPGGPAALALRTGAALLPVGLWFEPNGWGAEVHSEIAVPVVTSWREKVTSMTQNLAEVFEEDILRHAEDWRILD